jgi:hypothetical protein
VQRYCFTSTPEKCVRCCTDIDTTSPLVHEKADQFDDITRAFVDLTNLPTYPLDRLNRYEAALWRQARQILTVLHRLDRRRPWERAQFRSRSAET